MAGSIFPAFLLVSNWEMWDIESGCWILDVGCCILVGSC